MTNITKGEYMIILKILRKSHHLTQEKLAIKLGVNQQTIARWERGATEPSIKQLRQLSEQFNVSVDELINNKPIAVKSVANIIARNIIGEANGISNTKR